MRSDVKPVLSFAALLLFALGQTEWSATPARAGEKITLRVAYTSDSNGYIDPCG